MSFFLVLAAGITISAVGGIQLNRRDASAESAGMCSLREDMTAELSQIKGKSSTRRCSSGFPKAHNGRGAGIDYMSFISTSGRAKKSKQPQRAVWVSGYPRSGSSVVLSMVSATMDDNREPGGDTFSIFEPCHDGDELTLHKEQEGCGSVLYGISRCDFKGIKNLWGWWDPHSTNNHHKFDAKNATNHCQAADVVAFKTVDWGHNLSKWTWLLDAHANMKVLDVVRDPRGIYASWKELEPFKTLVDSGEFYTLTEICDHFAMNLQLKDDRVHRVVFEELMDDPTNTVKAVYKFMNRDFGDKQRKWISAVFNSTECPPPPPELEGFTDCHVKSSSAQVVEKWRTILTAEEKAEYRNSKSCQDISKAYGWRH